MFVGAWPCGLFIANISALSIQILYCVLEIGRDCPYWYGLIGYDKEVEENNI
jgi:hypothetical protein